MKTEITLTEHDLKTAVTEYLQRRGYKAVCDVQFSQSGYPDSPDPRELAVGFSAKASADGAKKGKV